MIRLSLVALCAALSISPALAKDKSKTEAQPIACEGVFAPDSSEARLVEAFGRDNVVTGMIPGPEGTEMVGTTIYPDDPERTMLVTWWDEQNLSHLGHVELASSHVAPGGVRLGMTVAEVEALNGGPFVIGGFWWDYGGYAQIGDGPLANPESPCQLSIRFLPQAEVTDDIDITAISGEVAVPSSEPLLARLDTRISTLAIGYPWPDDLPMQEHMD